MVGRREEEPAVWGAINVVYRISYEKFALQYYIELRGARSASSHVKVIMLCWERIFYMNDN